MAESKRDLLVAALLARGYQASRFDPMRDAEQRFSIDASAARRIDDNATVVVIGDFKITAGKQGGRMRSLAKETRQSLYEEGERLRARPRSFRNMEDMGL